MNQLNALIQPDRGQKATALHMIDKAGLPGWLASLSDGQRELLGALTARDSAA
jgi:leucyl aminopeptidase